MIDGYIEVYSMLSDTDRLIKDDYDYLVSTYGKEVVDLVIKDLIDEDTDNIYRFEIDKTDSNIGLSTYTLYRSDLNCIPCLNAEQNLVLMKKIADIISELEKIFVLFDCDNTILGKGKITWLEDKIDYCLKECNNDLMLNRIRNLANRYIFIRDIVVNGSLRLVISIASKYEFDSADSFLELIQNGNIGLMKAVEKYNINEGTAFSTYATYIINGNIKKCIKNLKYPVKLSGHYIRAYHSILTIMNNLTMQLGREVTIEEVAEYMEKSVLWIQEVMVPFLESLSLDELYEVDDECVEGIYRDYIVDENVDIYDVVYKKYLQNNLLNMIDKYLTERQLSVLMYYYGFYGREYKETEIASILGVSRQRVNEIRKMTLTKLRKREDIMDLVMN